MTYSSIRTHYRPKPLFTCIALGLLVFASWQWPPTRAYWDQFDREWFYFANGSLTQYGKHWQIFWAGANHRLFDVIPGSLLLLIFAVSAWRDHRKTLAQRFAIGVFMALYCVFSIQLVRILMTHDRLSPTLVLEGANRLTQLVPFINSKDSSTFSFPGDHATVMCLVACFIAYFCGRKYGIAAFAVAGIFSIPRTVGGAHWASDVLVAASLIPLIACALALFTPLGGWAIAHIERIATPYLKRYLPKLF